MSILQYILKKCTPNRFFKKFRSQSEQWYIICPHCKFERSVWEMGGIRFIAYGNPRWYWRCDNCGRHAWHILYQKNEVLS